MPANCTEWIEVEARDGITVLHLSPDRSQPDRTDLDPRRYRVDMAELSRIADENAPCILLNFDGLTRLHGPELTPFMRLAMRIRQRNGRIAACHLPDGMQELLEVARLDRVVAVYESQEQALSALNLPLPA